MKRKNRWRFTESFRQLVKRAGGRNRSHSLAKSNCFFLVEYKNKNKILSNEFAVSSFQMSRRIRNHHCDNNQEINILYALSRNGPVTYTKRILNVDPKSDARLAKSQQHLWIWAKALRRIIQYTTCNLFWQISEFFTLKIFQGASLSELLSQTERKYIFFFNERSEIIKINGTGKIIFIKGQENHFQTFRKAICKMA